MAIRLLKTASEQELVEPSPDREAQLCEQYEASPMTARRALGIFLDEGRVTRHTVGEP